MKLEAKIERFLAELGSRKSRHQFMRYDTDQDVRSRRPNEWHRRAFKRGWGDAQKALKGTRRPYTYDTLRYLTWCDLGYRFVRWGHAQRQKLPEREQAYQLFRNSLSMPEMVWPASTPQNAVEDRLTDKDDEVRRRFWVVSPNVRNNNRTVSQWRQASLKCKAAFMGWDPDDNEHKQIGYKFAKVVSPNDILLIARRYRGKPEIVGFGVVIGRFKKSLKGFKPPESFGSLRKLSPFKPLSAVPAKLPIMHALGQTNALRELHPTWNLNHRTICEWMERTLSEKRQSEAYPTGNAQANHAHLADLPHEHELEYKVRTRRKIVRAKKAEADLVGRYREWLKSQHRKLQIVKYKSLRCDAFEKERGNLLEAKCAAGREYIRMAVGQLLEYGYLGRKRFGRPHMAILLPERPDPKSVEWLRELHISVVWKEKDVFLDNANGQFT